MSALYLMRYIGPSLDMGAGALYVGRNVILGVDTGGNRYKGSYTEDAGRIHAEIDLTVVEPESKLVTGITVTRKEILRISADLPLKLDDGSAHPVHVAGISVNVVFEKIGDIP